MGKKRNPKGSGNFRDLPDGRVAWRQTIDGKTREISAKTMTELKEKIKGIANLPITKANYTVEEWFDRWLEIYVKPLKSAATYNQYNDLYRVHVKPKIGYRKINNIKPVDVQSVISEMSKKTRTYKKKNLETKELETIDTGKKLSSSTMKHTRKIMNIAFSKAFKEQIIPINPVIDIEIPVKQAKERKALTPEELGKLFKSLESSRWIWSVKFDLVTGLRRGELLALKWTDIDFENKRIKIDESDSITGLGDTKSNKIHYVPLSDNSLKYLEGQINQLKHEGNPIVYEKDIEGIKKDDILIFPNVSGVMLKPRSYYTMMARAAKKVGIKATPHCIRHTFVYITRETLSLKELQAILGHDESTTTLDIYGDMINDSSEKTAARIDEIFDNISFEVKKSEDKKVRKEMPSFLKRVK